MDKVGGSGREREELSRTVELDVWDRPRLEPAPEGNDGHNPSEGETRDCNSQTRDHHDIVSSLSHRGHSQVRGAEHKHQTPTCQEESGQGFGGRSARESRTGRCQPQEEVGQASHDRECVGGHCDASYPDADSGEGVE